MLMQKLLDDFDRVRAILAAPQPTLAHVTTAVALQEDEFTVQVKVYRNWRTKEAVKVEFMIEGSGGKHYEGDTLASAWDAYAAVHKPKQQSSTEAVAAMAEAMGQAVAEEAVGVNF